jgi:hypothetical protein
MGVVWIDRQFAGAKNYSRNLIGAIMAEKINPWNWFVEKILPPLFVAMAVAVGSASALIWKNVNELSISVSVQEREIQLLKVGLKELQTQSVTRSELLETMKRVEQQLEIMMLRSKLSGKIEVH